RLAEHDYRLVWTSHHALLDGRSRRQVLEQVFALYDALCKGRGQWVQPPRPFHDHVQWLVAKDFEGSATYWTSLLAGFPSATSLPPTNCPRTDVDDVVCHRTLELVLSQELTQALHNLAHANQVTFNTLLQGAWALLLSFYAGTEDVVFGATRACRRSSVAGAESIIGLLINTLPVRVRVPASASLIPWLKALRSQWVAMREYEHTSLAQVQSWSEVPTGKPLFESIVVFENFRLVAILREPGDAATGRQFQLRGVTNYPLVLAGFFGRRVLIELTYDLRCFDEDTI